MAEFEELIIKDSPLSPKEGEVPPRREMKQEVLREMNDELRERDDLKEEEHEESLSLEEYAFDY